jgi:hypothetical protein
MCVKLSAESAKQQSPGWKSEQSELWNPGLQSRVTLNPERATQVVENCAALSGLILYAILTQGFGCFAASTLGFAVSRFQRLKNFSLTRMPFRAL